MESIHCTAGDLKYISDFNLVLASVEENLILFCYQSCTGVRKRGKPKKSNGVSETHREENVT